jgi:sterol desaturase/sphingolipid hydroxylase (fatty acid hydroxylase superfamily)
VLDYLAALTVAAAHPLWGAAQALVWPALFFAVLALAIKQREAITGVRRACLELRSNLGLHFADALFVAPAAAAIVIAIQAFVSSSGLALVSPSTWRELQPIAVLPIVLLAGDFIGYWRHRIEHLPLLWPAHAIHHSDTQVSWLTLSRFHPLNRFTTVGIDTAGLAILGFPDWALAVNFLIRHYYGMFIHADLPWTYGVWGRLLVSPAMHRWHHVLHGTGVGSNFATLFSVFDRAFGTFYVPGVCSKPLGVEGGTGRGLIGQLVYPFMLWALRVRGHALQLRDN